MGAVTNGPWRLHNEDTLGFWVHPIVTKRFLWRRWKAVGQLFHDETEYLVFEVRRDWYHTVTRGFDHTTEVVRTIEDVIADGTKAVYDWRSGDFIHADGALA